MIPSFEQLVALAREGRLSDGRDGADAAVRAFLDRYQARVDGEDPVPTLLSCAAEAGGPVEEAARAWRSANPGAPPFLRRRSAAPDPGLVLRPDGPGDAYALDADAAGDVIVVVDHGSWPDGHAILVFDLAARSCRTLPGDDRRWGHGVAVAPDGTWAVVVAGRKPHVVDLRTDTVTALPKGHRSDVGSVAVTGPDTFVTGGQDGALHHWNRAGKKLASVPKAHPSYLVGLAVRAGEVWSTGFDSRIRVWRLPDLEPVRELATPDGWGAVPLADGDLMTRSGRLRPDGTGRYPFSGAFAVDEAGGRLYVGNDEGVHVHDLATGERLATRPGLRPQALLLRRGLLFVIERYHPQLHVFPVASLAASAPSAVNTKVSFLAPSPDGSRLVVVREGGGGRIEVERGGRLHHGSDLLLCDAEGGPIAPLADTSSPFAFAGDLLVARGGDGEVRAFALRDGALRWALPGLWPARMVKERLGRACAAAVGDGLALVAARGTDQEGIDLRDPASGGLRAAFGPWTEVRAVFADGPVLWFSTERSVGRIDGGALSWEVAVSSPRSLRVRGGDVFVAEGATIRHLAAADGADRGTWKGRFKKPLHCLAIDGAGRVWSGGDDGRLRAWDPARGVEVAQAEPGGGKAIWHVRASGDLVHTMSGFWAHAVTGANTSRTVAEPWGTLTEVDVDVVGDLFPEGTYQETLTVHHLPTGRSARWVADRSNLTVTALGRRVWVGGRTAPGPIDVLDWVEPSETP